MADYTTQQSIDWTMTWASTDGIYLTEQWTADMTVTINEALTTLTTSLNNVNRTPTPGDARGSGFINASGFAWAPQQFNSEYELQDVTTDTFDACWNQLLTAAPQLNETMIFGVSVRDSDLATEARQGTSWQGYTFNINGTEELEQGIQIIGAWSRYYRWQNDAGETLDTRYAVVQSNASFDITYPDSDNVPSLDYYPWARRVSGVWVSCDSDGHSLRVYNNGAWADRKNNLVDDSRDTVWYRSGDAWAKALKIGE